MTTKYENIWSSVFRFCSDFGDELQGDGVLADFEVFNFDAHVENKELPEKDLIGPWQLSVTVDEKLGTVTTNIGMSTRDDTNLFRLEKASGRLLERLMPDAMVTVYDADTGVEIGHLKVLAGVSLSPVARAQQRSLKFLAITLKGDFTF